MPQHRTPTAILEAKGAFLKDPQRKHARENEPTPTGEFGAPPSDFDKEHKAVWLDHAAKIPAKVASNWDETAFEVLVCLIVNFRRRRRSNMPQVVGEVAQMVGLFARFGMTPADRSRVHAQAEGPKKDDPWSKLMDKPQ